MENVLLVLADLDVTVEGIEELHPGTVAAGLIQQPGLAPSNAGLLSKALCDLLLKRCETAFRIGEAEAQHQLHLTFPGIPDGHPQGSMDGLLLEVGMGMLPGGVIVHRNGLFSCGHHTGQPFPVGRLHPQCNSFQAVDRNQPDLVQFWSVLPQRRSLTAQDLSSPPHDLMQKALRIPLGANFPGGFVQSIQQLAPLRCLLQHLLIGQQCGQLRAKQFQGLQELSFDGRLLVVVVQHNLAHELALVIEGHTGPLGNIGEARLGKTWRLLLCGLPILSVEDHDGLLAQQALEIRVLVLRNTKFLEDPGLFRVHTHLGRGHQLPVFPVEAIEAHPVEAQGLDLAQHSPHLVLKGQGFPRTKQGTGELRQLIQHLFLCSLCPQVLILGQVIDNGLQFL